MGFRTFGWLLVVAGCGGELLAAPVVSSFSPAKGVPGIQVTVQGADLAGAAEVRFGLALADFVVVSANRLVAVVPVEGTTGRIHVTAPSGTGQSSSDFMVAPRIEGFLPGRSATNTTVTIEGFNLTEVTNVWFAGRAAKSFTATAPTQIRAVVPFGATNGPISLASPAGVAVAEPDFVVTGPGPVIDRVVPGAGAPGTTILLEGANFVNVQSVKFNGVNSPSFSAAAETQLSAQVPASATTGKITVTTAGGTTNSPLDFVVTRAPIVTGFSPSFGRAGTEVRVEGINFNSLTGVGFNGKPVAGIGTPSPGVITVTVPNGATTGRISVTNSFGSGLSGSDFVVTTAPIVDGFEPAFGGPGTSVRIDGANFNSVPLPSGVKFGGVTASSVSVTADTQMFAVVPAGAATGPITVTNAGGITVTATNFFVTGSAPYVTEASPSRGPRGTEVILTGGNFTSPATVSFNGVTDPGAVVTALTQIRARVPATATSGPIRVVTGSGSSTNTVMFHLPPRLTAFTPASGVVGSTVTLAGLNFVDVSEVLFNGAPAGFTVMASNQLTAVVPGAASNGPLTVRTPGGVIISTNAFTVLPVISGFAPEQGPVGTLVTIDGSGFNGVTVVTFSGVASQFEPVSNARIEAIVPAGAATGPIEVTAEGGVVATTNVFVVSGPSDVAISMAASAPMVAPGSELNYTLMVTNQGPSAVSAVTVTNQLPSNATFLSAAASRGSFTNQGARVIFSVGNLPRGGSTVLGILVRAASTGEGFLINSANVRSLENDLDLGNNAVLLATPLVSDASRTLAIRRTQDGSNVVVSWPASPLDFQLESLTVLGATNVWLPVVPGPVEVDGQNVLTNPAAGAGRYYRLLLP